MKDILEIILRYGQDLLNSLKFQIPLFVVSLFLWSKPKWFVPTHKWIVSLQEFSVIIIIFIFSLWGFNIILWFDKKSKLKKDSIKRLRSIITNNHIHSSYLDNNLLYIIYNNDLKKFSFQEICGVSEKNDLGTEEGIEDTIESFLKDRIVEKLDKNYKIPSHIWRELSSYAESKQLRRKR